MDSLDKIIKNLPVKGQDNSDIKLSRKDFKAYINKEISEVKEKKVTKPEYDSSLNLSESLLVVFEAGKNYIWEKSELIDSKPNSIFIYLIKLILKILGIKI